jgi:uncharacterized membrane protein YeaQ/YmgE (transglycosylase-associated protein family)
MLAMLLQYTHSRSYSFDIHSSPFLIWLLIGLLAGWLAGQISRGAGYGCIVDILLGLIGSVIGGWIFMRLGIPGYGFWYSLAAATVGAVVLVLIVHLLTPGRRP